MNCDCKNIVNPSGVQLSLECLIGWGRKINKSFRPFWLKSNSVYNKQTNKQNTIDVKQWKREYTGYSRQIEQKKQDMKVILETQTQLQRESCCCQSPCSDILDRDKMAMVQQASEHGCAGFIYMHHISCNVASTWQSKHRGGTDGQEELVLQSQM